MKNVIALYVITGVLVVFMVTLLLRIYALEMQVIDVNNQIEIVMTQVTSLREALAGAITEALLETY